jgi:hypothetical protein
MIGGERLSQKLATVRCLDELSGFEGALRERGAMTPEIQAQVAERRVELMRAVRAQTRRGGRK